MNLNIVLQTGALKEEVIVSGNALQVETTSNTLGATLTTQDVKNLPIHGRDYMFFYDDDRLRMVAWKTDEGSFWLSNTLIESLTNSEMLQVAEGFRELGGSG